ncbi:venom acid phosphatase Acph-1-like [Linepithema humile]|uniref:venom acid phosphatase Acph-1-like n=1 Tax=Linepithema humile TaxID=83485 RepID=UPI00351F5A25
MYRMTKLQYCLNIVLIFYSGLFITPGFSTNNTGNTRLYHGANLVPNEYQDTFTEAKANDTKLRFVSAIFRHGDRTPEDKETYPNDPYKNEEYYPTGRGQLTNAGKKRSYELGLLLRKLYDHFLGTTYYHPYVYARSTFIIRCGMTLQLVLAALFPPNNMQQWNHQLLWQPTYMRYSSLNEDTLMMSFTFPAYKAAFKKVLNSTEVLEKIEKYRDLMEKVSAYAGSNITDLYQLVIVRFVINIQLSMGLVLPKAAHILYANKEFFEATRLAYDLFAYNEELIRLSGGTLLQQITEDMNEVINGTTNRKINLFSGHDINVVAILRALHIKNEIYSMPNFTSSVILELHEWKDMYFVKVLYYWGIPAKVETLSIPGCTLLCPYDRFLNLISTTIATDANLISLLHLEKDASANACIKPLNT